jgi:diguanylate cyclase (GGDEF)-like protein
MREPRKKVLVIDDNALMGEILADYLRTEDLAVRVAKSGEQGLRMLAAEPADVVVIDLVMPGMGGLEILARTTRRRPHPEVIIVTAFGTVETAVRAVQLGAFDYLQKPVNPEVLRETVLRAIERQRLLASNDELRHGIELYEHCRRIISSTHRSMLLEQALWALLAATGAQSGLVRLLQPEQDEARLVAHEGLSSGQALDLGRSVEEVMLRDAHARPVVSKLEDGLTALVLPISRGDTATAVIAAFKLPEGSFSDADLRDAQFLADQVGFSMRYPVRSGEEHDVFVDEQTGLYNSRYFDIIVDRELIVAQSEPSRARIFSLLVIAVDEMGAVTDRFGKRIGSKVLVEVGRVTRHRVREVDPVFRMRPDRYSVLLRGSDSDEAKYVAERVRRAIESHPFLSREGLELRLTVSIAIVSFPEHGLSKERLLELIETALVDERREAANTVILPGGETGGV